MAFQIPQQPYSGKIGEVTVGTGDAAVTVGGEDCYPFHVFEGNMPNPPKIAMEIWDYDPSEEWPEAAVAPFKDVINSPEAWAKKCVDEYSADMIVVQLKSTDPNGKDRNPEEAAAVFKKVADAVKVPVIAWGTANNEKDEQVLRKIAEVCDGMNVGLAPVEEGNHKGVGATALGYKHTVVASTPIDVNLAKQLNILLNNLGVNLSNILIDPTTGGLGYGMEYSYSVMERIRMAALTQEDDKLQLPMINNIGNEVWKCKEAGQGVDEAPTLGDPEKRPILMEAISAACFLLAGSDIVILRHPETVRFTRAFIELMINGGMATDVEGIAKNLEAPQVDLAALAPEPDLTIEEEKPAAKKAAAPKKEEKPAEKKEAKAAEKKAKEAPKEKEAEPAEKKPEKAAKEEKKAEEIRPKEEEKKKEEEEKEKAEEEAKKKAEEEAKKKAEEEAKKKAEEEAKKKAEQEAKKKAEEEAKKREKEREELLELRRKRAEHREKLAAERASEAGAPAAKTPAKDQMDLVDKLIRNIDRIHRRV